MLGIETMTFASPVKCVNYLTTGTSPLFLLIRSNIFLSVFRFLCLIHRYYVLDQTDGLHDMGVIRWQLLLCFIAVWIIVYLCIIKGVKTSGKVGGNSLKCIIGRPGRPLMLPAPTGPTHYPCIHPLASAYAILCYYLIMKIPQENLP